MIKFKRIYLIAAVLVLVIHSPFVQNFAADTKVRPKNAEKELYRITTKDNSITAVWIGVNPNIELDLQGMPLEYGVRKLFFEFLDNKEKLLFKPTGNLAFNNWSFDIFSPDHRYVVLLQGYYGPFHIIPVENLRDYLKGNFPPLEIVSGKTPDGPAAIHGEFKWIAVDTIEFNAACCGGGYMVVHQIGKKTKYGKWKQGLKHLK